MACALSTSVTSRDRGTSRLRVLENYFNYFTEIEECYRRCRNTPTLLSTLDWALIESWKEAGIPLKAVLVGIERAFAKFQARPRKYQRINSLAYCAQQVFRAAEEMSAMVPAGESTRKPREAGAPFAPEEIQDYVNGNVRALELASRQAQQTGQPVLAEDFRAVIAALQEAAANVASKETPDLEELERHMTALEEKLTASLTRASSVELLAQFHQEAERGLGPSRRKMTGAQIESLERQFLKKRLFEHYQVPRLSLFYL